MKRYFRVLAPAVVALTGTLALSAGPAAAVDTVTGTDFGSVQYADDPGDASTLTVTATPGEITITQSGGDTLQGSNTFGCPNTNAATITCTAPALRFVSLDLGNMDDSATLNGSLGGSVGGGEGVDTLTGSDTNGVFERLSGGDGNDIINTRNVGASLFPSTGRDSASGGDGNDLITTGNGDDDVSGDGGSVIAVAGVSATADPVGGDGDGSGADVISTGTGDDFADGGLGDGDRVDLGEGNDVGLFRGGDGTGDVTDGGPGLDRIDLASDCCPEPPPPPDVFSVDLAAGTMARTNAPAESGSIPNFEDVRTTLGADTVLGTDASNAINTGGLGIGADAADGGVGGDGGPNFAPDAADTVNPRGGADLVATGPGDDSIDSRDGFQDRVSCGSGTDTVQADQFDLLDVCENVTVTETRAAGADVDAPGCRVAKVKKSYNSAAFRKGITVRVTCDEAATLLLRIVATLRGGNNLTAKAGDLVLAERTVKASANKAKGTKLKPSKKLLKRFRKGKGLKARVVVEARDQYGNRSQKVKRLKVKKGGKRKKR